MSFDKFIKNKKKVTREEKQGKLTTFEKEELDKKKTAEAKEYLETVADLNEDKGAKATIEVQDKQEALEREIHEREKKEASKKRKTKIEYQIHTATKLAELADTIDWPKGFRYRIGKKDDDKLSLLFEDDRGNVYARGIKLTGTVIYDLNALHILVTQAENTVDKLQGTLASQNDIVSDKIWTPTSDNIISQYALKSKDKARTN